MPPVPGAPASSSPAFAPGTGTARRATEPPLKLSKRALSLFFRVGCERQLLLYLYSDPARAAHGMPPRQEGRAGLGLVGRYGYRHQALKVTELQGAFGAGHVRIGSPRGTDGQTEPVDLGDALVATGPDALADFAFVVEAQFPGATAALRTALGITHLVDRHGYALDVSALQPDLVQILPPLAATPPDAPWASGGFAEAIEPDGTTVPLSPNDPRRRLRVLDIKASSEPGAHYFAEVVFYSMALAAWLRERGLVASYVVVAAPAVVPGSMVPSQLAQHVAAWQQQLHQPTAPELTAAFEADVEIAPVEAFAPRLRELLGTRLPALLQQPWADTTFHVSPECRGCEFLGDPHILNRDREPTQHERHCWVQAEAGGGALCQIVGLSRGATGALRADGVPSVQALATTLPLATAATTLAAGGANTAGTTPAPGAAPAPALPPAFRTHHGLRAQRTVFPARADALVRRAEAIIPASGTDALMPRWPDLHLYLFLDYDPATALTITFGCRAFWQEPLPFQSSLTPERKRWGRRQGDEEVFIVDAPDPAAERREFLKLLRHLREILRWVAQHDADDGAAGRRDAKSARSTYQIYLWDEAQRRHLVRLVSRHLAAILADPDLRDLAWLFPPPELLATPELETRRSPYTLVYDVVQRTVALPTPHHYTLLAVAAAFHPPTVSPPSVHPRYRETLSNLAPPERIHEYWERQGDWDEAQGLLRETTARKLAALGMVVAELERRLGDRLSRISAPPLPAPPSRTPGLAPEGYLWLEYTRLNAALTALDADRTRAMPPHERESRFRSARLTRRVDGAERLAVLGRLRQQTDRPLTDAADLLIYALADDSRDFNARPGDLGFALAPAADPSFLDRHPFSLLKDAPPAEQASNPRATTVGEAALTAVTVEAIDRAGGWAALRLDPRNRLSALERVAPQYDWSRDVMLDPVPLDTLSKKVRLTLQGIGNPPIARPSARLLEALGLPPTTTAGTAPVTPAAEILWDAAAVAARPSGRAAAAVQADLARALLADGQRLMPDQWTAWAAALDRQLAIIWGPPGTGKSLTLRAIVLGAVLDARARRMPLRLLVTANTYTAVDNVLLKLRRDLAVLDRHLGGGISAPCRIVRVQSEKRPVEHDFARDYPGVENLPLNAYDPTDAARDLVRALQPARVGGGAGRGRARGASATPATLGVPDILIVGAPAQQVHNLATCVVKQAKAAHTQRAWFDLTLLDEASQMDVASSTLIFSKRAPGGTIVLAGDDLQLPPIDKATPPDGLEASVGSVYSYVRERHGVAPLPLNVSFRANATLVAFTREAGYDAALRAHAPDLRLDLDPAAIPAARPDGWPVGLPWSPDYRVILDPGHAAVCVVHDDVQSAQSNAFEADHIAALVYLLRQHQGRVLLGERHADGTPAPAPATRALHTGDTFWGDAHGGGVGVVTPHRAQMGLIAARLQTLFPQDRPDRVRGAVDTVERFQGQQRDVVLASFGLGDPDVIRAEEEFLYNLRRFNVMASRARAKLVVFVTRSLVAHLSDDRDVLAESLLLKRFAEQFCRPLPEGDARAATGPWEIRLQ